MRMMSSLRRNFLILPVSLLTFAFIGCKSKPSAPSEASQPAGEHTATNSQAEETESLAIEKTPRAQFSRLTFAKDLSVLTSSPHRLAGFENGSLAAGRYVESRLRKIGVEPHQLYRKKG